MNILAVGDSFTYGEELDALTDAYPYRFADMINGTVVNMAKPGSGNKRMIRTVIEQVAGGNHIDLVLIGWTSAGRTEYADMDGHFDLWPGYSGRIHAEQQPWRLELLEYINKYHSPEYIYQQYLIDIIMMQSYLSQNNIRYIMMTTFANEYYHNIYFSRMQPLARQIDNTYFVGWPSAGMAEWTNGCKRGLNGHFLAAGHKKVAEELYKHIQHLGWTS